MMAFSGNWHCAIGSCFFQNGVHAGNLKCEVVIAAVLLTGVIHLEQLDAAIQPDRGRVILWAFRAVNFHAQNLFKKVRSGGDIRHINGNMVDGAEGFGT